MWIIWMAPEVFWRIKDVLFWRDVKRRKNCTLNKCYSHCDTFNTFCSHLINYLINKSIVLSSRLIFTHQIMFAFIVFLFRYPKSQIYRDTEIDSEN